MGDKQALKALFKSLMVIFLKNVKLNNKNVF